ncbi:MULTISPECIES: hypothetical protein [unclassified Nonomuraea]
MDRADWYDVNDLARLVNEPIGVIATPDGDAPYPLGRPASFRWPAKNRR